MKSFLFWRGQIFITTLQMFDLFTDFLWTLLCWEKLTKTYFCLLIGWISSTLCEHLHFWNLTYFWQITATYCIRMWTNHPLTSAVLLRAWSLTLAPTSADNIHFIVLLIILLMPRQYYRIISHPVTFNDGICP